jgi:adenine-specific DNA-methyltransferase
MTSYSHLTREQLIAMLQRREREAAFGLTWERDKIDPDKAMNDDFVALDLDRSMSHGETPWRDLIIEGDNYDALRYLRMTHAGKVKCIYIDPPYNTGNRDCVYNDHFFDKTHRFRHSVWLEFMYERLLLARELLHPEGVIFVSIDDNELFPLGMLMNRVFGEKNFVANCIWQKRYSRENRGAGKFDNASISRIAKKIGISPGIVVGRLQHDNAIHFSKGNSLKTHYWFSQQEA